MSDPDPNDPSAPAERPDSASAASVVFYDVEASSLSEESYPVEVGWAWMAADGSVHSEAMLVRPIAAWCDWSAEAEAIHGISREQLEELGHPVEEVAVALDAAFGTRVVYSDAPEWEARWTNRLYDAAGRKRQWRIGDAPPLLRATAATKEDNFWLSVHLEEPRLHRADADARVLAEAYAELRRRRERFGRMHVVPKGPPLVLRGEDLNNFAAPEDGARLLDALAVPVPIEDWAGPVADAPTLARDHGIARSDLEEWERRGIVIGFDIRTRGRVYPVEQFHAGQPLRGLDDVLRMARSSRVAWDWLVRPHTPLDGARPIDRLRAGEVERVLVAAHYEWEEQW